MLKCIPFLSLYLFLLPLIGQNLPYAGRMLLVPIDDRPAVAQFAVMIGAIADHEVKMPPSDLLGRFTVPGNPEKIREWLQAQNYEKVDALIVSVDMLAYGGLVASRSVKVSVEKALERLEFFKWLKKKHPRIPIYAFSVIMRVAPTADASTRPWRDRLARWAELKDRAQRTGDPKTATELAELDKGLEPSIRTDYLASRKRDLAVNLAALDLAKNRIIDALVFLQDDAREYGLHRQDQEVLRRRLKEFNMEQTVPVYNGADEGSLTLVSRAAVEKYKRPIRIATVYSSQSSREVIAPFEDHPLHYTVENQIRSAGGLMVQEGQKADYRLYINGPKTTDSEFESFTLHLTEDLKAGRQVALADILFPPPHYSGSDERLIGILQKEGLLDKLTAYAGWNTAGNTLGTAIPQANLRILFQSRLADSPERSARALAAQLEFLLHRFVGDYIYHDIVRFQINRRLRQGSSDPTDEFTAETYARINRLTEEQLRPEIEEFFAKNFQGKSYSLGAAGSALSMKIKGLQNLVIRLPWPRTFEVAVEYRMDYTIIQ